MENKRRAIDYFWIVSRVILIIMFFYPMFNISESASVLSNVINGSSLIYIILMIIVCKDEILENKKKNQLKLYTGVLSLMYGIYMIIFLINLGRSFGNFESFIGVFMVATFICVWMILFGIHDLRNRKMS